jgi:ferritin
MESGINSDVRQLCKAVYEEQDPERVKFLLDTLTEALDERMLVASLI